MKCHHLVWSQYRCGTSAVWVIRYGSDSTEYRVCCNLHLGAEVRQVMEQFKRDKVTVERFHHD